jgi:hypothetical protein
MPKMGAYIGSEQLVTINELVDIVEDIPDAQLQPDGAPGRPWAQQRQHADRRTAGLGPVHQPRGRLQNKWIFDQMSEGAAPITR